MQDKLNSKEALILYVLAIYQLVYGKAMMYRTLKLINEIGIAVTPAEIERVFKKALATGRVKFNENGAVFVRSPVDDFREIATTLRFKVQRAIMEEWLEQNLATSQTRS